MSEVNTGTLKSRVIELVDDQAKRAQVLLKPDLISETKRYFTEVQTKDTKYEPFLSKDDRPPLDLNRDSMARLRPLMEPFYYDAAKHETYLDQLGVKYPVLERPT
jgi:aminobenzoyl-glutamate utilization protein B